jgi:hypothetical protein
VKEQWIRECIDQMPKNVEDVEVVRNWTSKLLMCVFMDKTTRELLEPLRNAMSRELRQAVRATLEEWRRYRLVTAYDAIFYGKIEEGGGFSFPCIGHAIYWLATGEPECPNIEPLEVEPEWTYA